MFRGHAGWRTRHPESLCFSPTGELLLYGPTLWDPRSPRCVHTFDLLTYSPCASTFHPAGLEVVVNAEVSLLGCQYSPMPEIGYQAYLLVRLSTGSGLAKMLDLSHNFSCNIRTGHCMGLNNGSIVLCPRISKSGLTGHLSVTGVGSAHTEAAAMCALPGLSSVDLERRRRLRLRHAATRFGRPGRCAHAQARQAPAARRLLHGEKLLKA